MTSSRAAPDSKPAKAAPSLAPAPEAGQHTAGPKRERDRRPPGDDTIHWLLGGPDGPPIQRKPIDAGYGDIVAAARLGTNGPGVRLPHLDAIQRSFGRNDVSGIVAHTDGSAAAGARAMGAVAFTMGNHVAFAGEPSLQTAAHEAAHVVQQAAGLQLAGGVGRVGDSYELHADEVAARVVAGRSSEDLLARYARSEAVQPSGNSRAVQTKCAVCASGGPSCETCRETKAPRLDLTAPPAGTLVQRQPAPRSTSFRDCSASTTLSDNPKRDLIQALDLAQRFVDGAISKLAIDPEDEPKGSSYRVALERHFLNPTKPTRMGILSIYKAILPKLQPGNVRCAANATDLDACALTAQEKQAAAFTRDGECFVCYNFWGLNPVCKAIVLIHEAAHVVGVGMGPTHPPYRGEQNAPRSVAYPFGAGPAGKGETPAVRSNNPDAYAAFAAHIWRDTDTTCILTNEVIDVRPTSNASPKSHETKEKGGK